MSRGLCLVNLPYPRGAASLALWGLTTFLLIYGSLPAAQFPPGYAQGSLLNRANFSLTYDTWTPTLTLLSPSLGKGRSRPTLLGADSRGGGGAVGFRPLTMKPRPGRVLGSPPGSPSVGGGSACTTALVPWGSESAPGLAALRSVAAQGPTNRCVGTSE